MKKFLLIILLFPLIGSSLARQITPSTRIALLDLTLRSAQSYTIFTSLSQAVGTTLVYLHPSKNLPRDLCGCEDVYIIFDQNFLSAKPSAYTQLITEPLERLIAQGNKIIGLLLPEQLVAAQTTNLIINFLTTIGLKISDSDDIKTFLAHKRQAMPGYPTLQQSASKQIAAAPLFKHALALPHNKVPTFLSNNMPLGILLHGTNNNRILITTLSACMFADLQEDSFINPLSPQKRKALLRETMHMLAYIQQQQSKIKKESVPVINYRIIDSLVSNKIQKLTCATFKKQQGVYKWTSNGISCGWMSVDYDKKFMPTNLAYIANTDFDVLWLELPIGLYKSPEQFNEKIKYFASQLLNAYHEALKELPKIIIDFNLGAILQWHHYASNPIDIYGNEYKNTPAPLDFNNFWHPAIIEVFKNVITQWNTVTKLPVDGVLFNLYFWNTKNHRYAMPFYSNLIDFSDSAWRYYSKRVVTNESINSPQDRISYIVKNNKIEEYLSTLEHGAFEIAQQIITDLHNIAPCAMVGIYTNAPLDTWFYRGFARALGSPQRPLLWFTENSNFYGHQTWINNNKIYALHVTNILLHHFNNQEDIKNINRLAKSHDGLWYSRVSRIGQQYQPNKWWSAEATTMEPKQLSNIINKQARK